MNLTFTTGRYGTLYGSTDAGLALFSISDSTQRNDPAVSLRCELPGMSRDIRVESAAGDDSFDVRAGARSAAIEKAGQLLRAWAAKHLGIDLGVNIIDNS